MIDTAFKRRSSAASRRMPWMRRFGIAPDGTVAAADRKAAVWVYAGIESASLVTGPGQFAAGQVHLPGFREGAVHRPGFAEGQVSLPGFSSGEAIF